MENENCVFCNIVRRIANATILHESDNIIIIKDIMPKAPVHALVMPKQHIESLNELSDKDGELLTELLMGVKEYARKSNIAESGYKIVLNVGKEGGQVVPHLHFHLLGGKQLEA